MTEQMERVKLSKGGHMIVMCYTMLLQSLFDNKLVKLMESTHGLLQVSMCYAIWPSYHCIMMIGYHMQLPLFLLASDSSKGCLCTCT
jgi:hypothetical protein